MAIKSRDPKSQPCMYCFSSADMNEEHVFPTAIGGSFSFYQPCVKCNSEKGQVDAHLLDHPLIVAHREQYDLRGHSGKAPSFLKEGTMAAPSEDGLGPASIRIRKTVEPGTGVWAAQVIPTFARQTIGDSELLSAAFPTEAEARKWFAKELKRQNALPQDPKQLEELWTKSVSIRHIEKPNLSFEVQIDTYRYRQAMLKIVYEMSWYWLGNSWLSDQWARKMRKILRGEPKNSMRIRGVIDIGEHHFFQTITNGMGLTDTEHSAILLVHDNIAFLVVTVFNQFYAGIMVTQDAAKYGLESMMKSPAPVLILDAIGRSHEFMTFGKALQRGREASSH